MIVAVYAFNENITQRWPIDDFTTKWFAWRGTTRTCGTRSGCRCRRLLGATAIALVLGTLASLAVARYAFFGRDTISLLVILPIALPGIVTGLALQATYLDVSGRSDPFGLLTIIIGHATFCIVVVYNNVVARMRRIPATSTRRRRTSARTVADVPAT